MIGFGRLVVFRGCSHKVLHGARCGHGKRVLQGETAGFTHPRFVEMWDGCQAVSSKHGLGLRIYIGALKHRS